MNARIHKKTSPTRSATAAAARQASAAELQEALAKRAFGNGPMVSVKLLQRYLDACTDQRATCIFLRQLFPVFYRLEPQAQRLLTRTMINIG